MKRYTYHVAFSVRAKGLWKSRLTQPFRFDGLYCTRQPIHVAGNYRLLRTNIAKECLLPEEDAYLVAITSLTLLHEQNLGDDDDSDPSDDPGPDLKLAEDLLDRFRSKNTA